jgi:hypothetical protein
MRKTALTVAVTAAVTFLVAATTGLAAGAGRVINVKVGDIVAQKSNNFHCQILAKTQTACGANQLKNAVTVYYTPHQLNVVQFNAAGTKATLLFAVKR